MDRPGFGFATFNVVSYAKCSLTLSRIAHIRIWPSLKFASTSTVALVSCAIRNQHLRIPGQDIPQDTNLDIKRQRTSRAYLEIRQHPD